MQKDKQSMGGKHSDRQTDRHKTAKEGYAIQNKNQKSLLNLSSIDITPNLSLKIPTVGEILNDEETYYSTVSAFTAVPAQYMVALDDMGIDYSKITDYELFQILFPIYAKSDLSLLFGNLDTSDFILCTNSKNNQQILYSPSNDIWIDEPVYYDLADNIRKINLFEKVTAKPGNESARKYLLEKERKKQKRHTKKQQKPYLENLVIALVNTSEFPYDYDSCMDLSIYRFNRSLRQIQQKITFDNTMIGVYAGTVDLSKINHKTGLSWIADNT